MLGKRRVQKRRFYCFGKLLLPTAFKLRQGVPQLKGLAIRYSC